MLSSLFPLSTPIGERIEKVTSETLPTENWEAILEICQLITASDNGAKDAIKAIQKRLSGKHPSVIHHTLILLDACVKNCDGKFHAEIANPEFVHFFVKLVFPKNTLTARGKEMVLEYLQNWADALGSQHVIFIETVRKLREQGVEFPAQDMDAMAPIITPTSNAPPRQPTSASSQTSANNNHTIARSRNSYTEFSPNSHPAPAQSHPQSRTQQTSPPVSSGNQYKFTLTLQQRNKLNEDLTVVRENVSLFREMLSAHEPGLPADSLLEELHDTCQTMQKRVLALLDQITDEDLIVDILRVNDELNAAISKYGNLTNKATAPRASQQPQQQQQQQNQQNQQPQEEYYSQLRNNGNNNNFTTSNTNNNGYNNQNNNSQLYDQIQNNNAVFTNGQGYSALSNYAPTQPSQYSSLNPYNNNTYDTPNSNNSNNSNSKNLIDFDEPTYNVPNDNVNSDNVNNVIYSNPTDLFGSAPFNPISTSTTTTTTTTTTTSTDNNRNSAYNSNPFGGSTYEDNLNAPQQGSLASAMSARAGGNIPVTDSEDDAFAKLAAARNAPKPQLQPVATSSQSSAALSTSDFDDFLAERGFIQPTKNDKKPLVQPSTTQRRQLDMDEKDDDMYEL